MSQIPLSGKFATFRMKPVFGETFMDASFWRVEAMPN